MVIFFLPFFILLLLLVANYSLLLLMKRECGCLSQADWSERRAYQEIALLLPIGNFFSSFRPSDNKEARWFNVLLWFDLFEGCFSFAYFALWPSLPAAEKRTLKTQTQLLQSRLTTATSLSGFGILGHLGNLIFQPSLLLFSGPKGGQMKRCAYPSHSIWRKERKKKYARMFSP